MHLVAHTSPWIRPVLKPKGRKEGNVWFSTNGLQEQFMNNLLVRGVWTGLPHSCVLRWWPIGPGTRWPRRKWPWPGTLFGTRSANSTSDPLGPHETRTRVGMRRGLGSVEWCVEKHAWNTGDADGRTKITVNYNSTLFMLSNNTLTKYLKHSMYFLYNFG